MISRDLVRHLRANFALDWGGIHGAPHWARVHLIGLRLARQTGANPDVVRLFAFLHDARRVHDGRDKDHGARAAALARSLRGRFFDLPDPEFALLVSACAGHSDGRLEGPVTVLTCWDADRLDLGRVGIRPDPKRLCTAAARDPAMIDWAWRRSVL